MSVSPPPTVPLPSGYAIPQLGLGVYQLPREETAKLVIAALQSGYRHIDTARLYRNEREVGEGWQASGLKREDVYLTTKLDKVGTGEKSSQDAVRKSARWLNVEHIDLVLIHSATPGKEKRLGAWRGLLQSKAAGLVKSIGVSNYGIRHLEELFTEFGNSEEVKPSVNQIELHPWCQQRDIVTYCRKKGIVIEAYSPLVRAQRMSDPTLRSIAQKHSRSPAQVLIRWSLQHGFVPLPKSSSPERVRENADVFGFELDTEDMSELDVLDGGKEGAVTWNPIDCD